MVPANPPMRIFRPFRSSTDLISLRNQPPICAPVLAAATPVQLKFFNSSLRRSAPPPKRSQEFIWRAFNPNGSAVPKVKAGSLPQ
jgi:hypothetical protein